jgi:hypothetical protein
MSRFPYTRGYLSGEPAKVGHLDTVHCVHQIQQFFKRGGILTRISTLGLVGECLQITLDI